MCSRSSLNHVYRTVWNRALGAMVAVAETTSSHGGGGSRSLTSSGGSYGLATPLALALAVALAWGAGAKDAWANPTGAIAVVGQVSTSTSGNTMTVTTQNGVGTNYSSTNWLSFSIGAGEKTIIQQPTANSTSINRVTTNVPSLIFGTLTSNGQVVLVNQSGITVGAGAVVDTAGFTASALKMSDADAISGRMRFGDGSDGGTVSVQGSILARSGDVVLLAGNIDTSKDALIQAPNGNTILAAGQQIEITGRGLEGISLQVQAPTDSVVNLGTLKGDAVGIFAGTLKHSGVAQANAVTVEGGKVVLKALNTLEIDGTVQAQALGQKGGSIQASATNVKLDSTALLDASGNLGGGEVLVGGGYQGHDARLVNAQTTDVAAGAQLKADAIAQGDGGTVVVWSDVATRYLGSLSALGGALGGNGGRAEVSGKQYLDFRGAVDLTAAKGKKGNLLLDPMDIIIGSSSDNFDGYGGGVIGDLANSGTYSGVMSFVNDSTLGTLLETSDVTLAATHDITFQSMVNTNGSSGSVTTLALNAGHDIKFTSTGQGVSSTANPLNVTWTAGNAIAGSGSYGAAITTYGGSVSLSAGAGGIGAASYGGAFTVDASGASTGTVTMTATGGSIQTGSVSGGGAVSITTTGTSSDITLAGDVSAAGASVTLNSGHDIVFAKSSSPVSISSGGSDINLTANRDIGTSPSGYGASISSGGGSIGMTATTGSIGYGSNPLLSLNSTGSGAGNITVVATGTTASNVALNTVTAGGVSDSSGGTVTIRAGGGVTTNTINVSGGQSQSSMVTNGGSVTIAAGNFVSTGTINAYGGYGGSYGANGGNGGSVQISTTGASSTINTGTIEVSGGQGGFGGYTGGNGGSVTISTGSTGGTVTVSGINANGGASDSMYGGNGGNGGSGSVTAGANSTFGTVNVSGGYGYGGGVTGTGGSGSLNITSGNLIYGSSDGGSVIGSTSLVFISAGSISQSEGITTGTLSTVSATGTDLSMAGSNAVSTFSGSASAGDLTFYNNNSGSPAALTASMSAANGNVLLDNYGAITTTGKVLAGGSVSITAHSPVTIGAGGITAGGGITLAASTDITLNGVIQSTGAGISFTAGGNLVQNSGVVAAAGITATAGGTMTFGPNGYSSGNPLSYSDSTGTISPPLVPLSALTTTGSTVSDFLDQFLAAVDQQKTFSDDPFDPRNRSKDTLVVEGQVCTP